MFIFTLTATLIEEKKKKTLINIKATHSPQYNVASLLAENVLVKCLARVNRVGRRCWERTRTSKLSFSHKKIKIFLPEMLGLEFLFHGIV